MIDRAAIVKRYGAHPGDVGGHVVQLAILDARIQYIVEVHFRRHRNDRQAAERLLKLKTRRHRLARRMEASELDRYHSIAQLEPGWKPGGTMHPRPFRAGER